MTPARRAAAALLAATVINLPFGTLYAFSVLLRPLEALLGATRAEMSFVFGLATVTLTVGMNVAPRLYRRFAPVLLAVASGALSAAGLWLAASATSFAQFAVGYGVLFGPGAGVLFIVAQQSVNQAVTTARGLANGYVVSLYPLGAMLGAPLLAWAVQAQGVRVALAALGAVVLVACLLAAALLRAADLRLLDEAGAAGQADEPLGPVFYRLGTVFFLAAAAGLTVLSQAAAIVQAYGGAAALAVGATTFITGAVGAARIAGGGLVDRFGAARVGIGAHACSLAGALVLLTLAGSARCGARARNDRGRVRNRLRPGCRCDRAVLAPQPVRPRREPSLHRLVRGGGEPAGARRLALRSHRQLHLRGVDRRRHQRARRVPRAPASRAARLTARRLQRNAGKEIAMLKQTILAATLAAAVPVCFAQSATNAPGSALGSSGSSLGQPGSSLGTPSTPGVNTGSPQLPSTGAFARPGDTTLPGTPTTPGLTTLPGAPRDAGNFGGPIPPSTPGPSVLPRYSDPLDRNSSMGATRPPFGLGGTAPRPSTSNCIPGSVTRAC